jgi:DNA-binding response OmpR family regulator
MTSTSVSVALFDPAPGAWLLARLMRLSDPSKAVSGAPADGARSTITSSLLLVEDVAALAGSLRRGLTEEGFDVGVAGTGEAALARMAREDVDAVILDLGLPDLDGLDVLSRARASGWGVPILVLTARDALQSRVRALEHGADDYLIKPFAFEELLARIRALLRRAAAPRWAPLACGDVVLDFGSSAFRAGSRTIALSPRERALLELLLRRRGETIGHQEILREAFGYHFDPGTNIVAVHAGHLRRKLEGTSARLESVRGAGYRISAVPKAR